MMMVQSSLASQRWEVDETAGTDTDVDDGLAVTVAGAWLVLRWVVGPMPVVSNQYYYWNSLLFDFVRGRHSQTILALLSNTVHRGIATQITSSG